MRAVVLSGPNQFAPAEIEKPQIGPDEILLEMKAAAICGTDMRILTGKKTKGVRYPSVIGHEFCGVIAEVGADVKGYEVGEKVAVANVIPCHHCSSCLRGRTNACLDRKAIGYEFDGGFEEYIRIPSICIENGNVVKLPEYMSYQAGALIEPLSCCIRGLKNAGTGFNDDVHMAEVPSLFVDLRQISLDPEHGGAGHGPRHGACSSDCPSRQPAGR